MTKVIERQDKASKKRKVSDGQQNIDNYHDYTVIPDSRITRINRCYGENYLAGLAISQLSLIFLIFLIYLIFFIFLIYFIFLIFLIYIIYIIYFINIIYLIYFIYFI